MARIRLKYGFRHSGPALWSRPRAVRQQIEVLRLATCWQLFAANERAAGNFASTYIRIYLQQPETAQFAPQIFRHVTSARCGAVEVARGVAGGEIAPSLERPVGPRLDQHGLAIEYDMAAANAHLVDKRADVENALATHDLTADHPVERTPVADFGRALRYHAGGMIALAPACAGLAGAIATRLELLLDPVLKIADRVAADAQLDEMQHFAASAG